MDVDFTTYNDLSLFQAEEEFSVFHKLNFTRTMQGKEWLSQFFNNPFSNQKQIGETQQLLRAILAQVGHWPSSITNGTLMVVERFYESGIDSIPSDANWLNALNYKLFHTADFSLVRYSITHFADFFRGLQQLIGLFDADTMPALAAPYIQRTADILNRPVVSELCRREPGKPLSWTEILYYGGFLKDKYRPSITELIAIYGRFDAWYSMARAIDEYKLSFPVFLEEEQPVIDAKQLYHILVPEAVPYDICMNRESNFLFLTGANMAGKSTFIRAMGAAVFLAHLGMGVPASSLRLTIFDGLLSNINVVDNIARGESYFFNEVQRIRNTIVKINNGKKWLVLIDELFKGTNMQDAMRCSLTVIKGLVKIRNSLFILSTHLYEIGQELQQYPNICFKFFETSVEEDQLAFSYQLKDGISNDRIGYLILKREKVVELLENLS